MDVNKLVFRFVRVSFSILILLLVLIGFVKIGTYCFDFGYRVFAEQPVDKEPGRDVTVEIKSGMSDRDIAKMLEQKGVIRDANIFFVQVKISAYSGKMYPGTYTVNTSMEAKEMMALFATKPAEEEQQMSGSETEGVLDATEEMTTEQPDVSEDTMGE